MASVVWFLLDPGSTRILSADTPSLVPRPNFSQRRNATERNGEKFFAVSFRCVSALRKIRPGDEARTRLIRNCQLRICSNYNILNATKNISNCSLSRVHVSNELLSVS